MWSCLQIVGFTQHCMDDLGAAQNLERWTNKLQAEGYNNTAQQNLLHLRELRLLRVGRWTVPYDGPAELDD